MADEICTRTSLLHGSIEATMRTPMRSSQGLFDCLEPRTLLSGEFIDTQLPGSVLANRGNAEFVVIGDIDGDGYQDILLSDFFPFNNHRQVGALVISGRTGSAIYDYQNSLEIPNVPPPQTIGFMDGYGAAVVALGDMTGDGVPDFAVSEPGAGQGLIHLYSGANGHRFHVVSDQAEDIASFGWTMTELGDVTGDGITDFIIGATDPLPPSGRPDDQLVLYSGATWTRVYAIKDLALGNLGEVPVPHPIGDSDSDGATDFIYLDTAYSGATGVPMYTIEGVRIFEDTIRTGFGAIRDIDNDGVSDFLGKITFKPPFGLLASAVLLYSGKTGTPIQSFVVDDDSSVFAILDDLDGDNFQEIVLRTRDGLSVYSVARGEPLQTVFDSKFSLSPASYGATHRPFEHLLAADINGDGVRDLLGVTPQISGPASGGGGPGVLYLFRGIDPSTPIDPQSIAYRSRITATSADGLFAVTTTAAGGLIALVRDNDAAPWKSEVIDPDSNVFASTIDVDPRSGQVSVYASTFNGLFRFIRKGPEVWETELIQDFSSVNVMSGEMNVFRFANGEVGLIGISHALPSEIALHELKGDEWTYTRLPGFYSGGPAPFGGPRPGITAYVAPWGAVHFTGVSQRYDSVLQRIVDTITTVWYSPETGEWRTSNIGLEVPEAEGLKSLSSFVTPWGALHVAGVTPEGHVGVLWWSPETEAMGLGWEYTDLTVEQGGPLFKPGSLTTYVTDWGGLNIAGVSADGTPAVYWWVPGFGADWVHESLGLNTSAPNYRVADRLLASIFEPRERGMRIFAADVNGEVLVYTWRPGQGSNWMFENLTLAV